MVICLHIQSLAERKHLDSMLALLCLSVTCAVFAMFLINTSPLYLVLLNLDDMRQHREMQNMNSTSSDEYYSHLLSWHEWIFVILVNAAITILSNLQTVVEQKYVHGVGTLHVSQQVATGETLLQVTVPTCASVKRSQTLLNEIAKFPQERQSWGHEKYLCKLRILPNVIVTCMLTYRTNLFLLRIYQSPSLPKLLKMLTC